MVFWDVKQCYAGRWVLSFQRNLVLHLLPAGSSETLLPIHQTTCYENYFFALSTRSSNNIYVYPKGWETINNIRGNSLLIYM
jgi:hypothetical protein